MDQFTTQFTKAEVGTSAARLINQSTSKNNNTSVRSPLVLSFCQALEDAEINYCHWKSNDAIDQSISALNDLDLLLSRADGQRFTNILTQLGFKQVIAPKRGQMPGVLDYFGYDQSICRFVHVHAHFQLILGHDMTKNYRLPLEEAYLASATKKEVFRIPEPEFEFIIFIIRMMLKHVSWDAVLVRQTRLKPKEKAELSFLFDRVDPIRVESIVQEHLPFVGMNLFKECIAAIKSEYPLRQRIKVGYQLQYSLQSHARYGVIKNTYLKIWRRITYAVDRRLFKRTSKYSLIGNGFIIAILGGDGAGKSTAISELYTWLNPLFSTKKVHLGKPPWSLTTKIVRGFLKIGYSFNRILPDWIGARNRSGVYPDYRRMIWHVCAARDRFLLYKKIRRFALAGDLIICDRFPYPLIKLMDGPQVARLSKDLPRNAFLDFLIRIEEQYYPSICPPDLFFVLYVNPEIAVQRKTDEDSAMVRARSTEVWELDWSQTPAHIVDASRNQTEVLEDLKMLVWASLI